MQWVLGLDIGSASIGWALVDRAGQRVGAAGVRIFLAGVDDAAFEKGQIGASNNTERRAKRLQRRQLRRRSARQRSLFLLLQRSGLLPAAEPGARDLPADQAASPDRRHEFLDSLDAQLLREFAGALAALPAPAQVLPYFLRAHALDTPLPPHALGRIFYHLAQRRGFRSNRHEAGSEREAKKQAGADERSQVKRDIGELQQEITAAGARTLGEYFSRLDPAKTKIRRRWTGRKMYEAEFEAIWTAQSPHHAVLGPELKAAIHRLLFHQRPIAAGRPGACELERGQPRAPMASLAAQRFRLLQKVNDLRLRDPELGEYALAPEERERLLDALEREGSLKFSEIKKRKLVNVPKGYRFNLEAGGEKTMPGNRTAAALRAVFGETWVTLAAGERDAAVSAWLDPNQDDDAFAEVGRQRFGLAGEALERWCGLELPDGYAKLSLAALARLLPLMERGVSFKAAETEIYGDRFSGGQIHDQLRPVAEALPELANPAVMRALSELRQLANAIVREYGKPYEIRIELARDLKRNAKQRQRLWENQRERETRRKKITAQILAEAGLPKVSRADIERGLLFEQSGGICPYCGKPISFQQAFEAQAAEVDHILPSNRFPDDSFGNKVLAHYACNQRKRGQTPYEAFGQDRDLWSQILERVRKWGDGAKQRAFQITEAADLDASLDDSFAARRLNDTRYATTLAARYLGEFYGGRDLAMPDGSRRRVIHASSGVATSVLRRGWGLEGILARHNEHGKNREDHRHHAVDAVAIALTSNTAIQQLSTAAGADPSGQQRVSSKSLVAPWPNFVDSVRPAIEDIRVSHRPDHRLGGTLHAETNYSRPHAGAKGEVVHLRRWVHGLKAAQVDRIVDARVRESVRQALAGVGDDAKKLEGNWPVLRTRKGALVPIRKVRVREGPAGGLKAVGAGSRERLIAESGNHHVALFAGRDARGRDCWERRVVSRLEATRRRELRQPIVARAWDGEGEFEFLYSLMGADLVEMDARDGGAAGLFVVRTISESASGQLELVFVPHTSAGKVTDLKAGGVYERVTSLKELGRRHCRKVAIDVLGRIHEAHD